MFPVWFNGNETFNYVPQGKIKVLQIGVYTGDATEWLVNNRDIEFIHDVDTWQGSREDAHDALSFSEVEKYYDSRFADNKKIVKFKYTSDHFFNTIPQEETYDFIYIDGDHTALQVALDGLNAFRVLKSGGIMGFDDYLWNSGMEGWLRPQPGVDAFLSVCQDKYTLIHKSEQVWIQKK